MAFGLGQPPSQQPSPRRGRAQTRQRPSPVAKPQARREGAQNESLPRMECLIRPATSDDCDLLMGFIQEIAKFHHLLDDVTISAEVLKADGFGKDPFYKCILAELPMENGCKQGRPVGYALYFFGYNVNHGRMLYLENLFVASEFRGKGIGQQLLARVAEIALDAGCVEMKFVTMEWNRPAKEFYVRLGAHDTTVSEELHCMELGREALQRLVQRGQRTGSANPCSGQQQPQA